MSLQPMNRYLPLATRATCSGNWAANLAKHFLIVSLGNLNSSTACSTDQPRSSSSALTNRTSDSAFCLLFWTNHPATWLAVSPGFPGWLSFDLYSLPSASACLFLPALLRSALLAFLVASHFASSSGV